MFLEQAEEFKKEYEARQALKKESKKSFASILGFGSQNNGIAMVQEFLNGTEVRPLLRSEVEPLKLSPSPKAEPLSVTTPVATSIPSPIISPTSSPVPTPSLTPTPTVKVEPSEEDSRSDLFKDPRSDLEVEKININTAGKEELMSLKGIGEVKSGAIVEYRETRGFFEKIEHIMDVKGIGLVTFDGIKDFITVGDTFKVGGGGGGAQTAGPTPTPTLSPTPSPTPEPELESALRKVVINEIAWMGTASSSNDEWIELYNTSSQSMSLSGWTLKAQDNQPNISLASKSIDPFGFYLLERTSNQTVSDVISDQIYTGALGNGGEILELRDAGENLQDIVSKSASGGWYAGNNGSTSPPQAKFSMERINPLTSGSNSTNWGNNNGLTKNGLDAGGNAVNGTPRSKNSIFVGQKPSKISNLAISSGSGQKVNFSWTAPSDQDTLSTNLQYNFRYATKSFDTTGDWDTAKLASGSPAVGNFGSGASFSLAIPDFNKTYYFAVKTKDVDNNFSDLSNQVSFLLPSAIGSTSWAMSGFDSSHTLKTSFLGPISASSSAKWSIQFWSNPASNFGQPVVAPNSTVYFGVQNGTAAQLWAVVPSGSGGSAKWEYSATSGASIGTPAVLSDNSVLFGYTSIGTEFTKVSDTGTLKYANNIGRVYPIVVDKYGTSYFTSSADKLVAVALDGTQKWVTYQEGITGLSPVALDDGKIYLTSRLNGVPNFYAFDAKDGNWLWSKTMSTGSSTCCGVSDVSYDAVNDFLYAGADQYILKIDRNGNTLEQITADRQVGWGYTTTMISQDTNNLVFGLDFSINNPASKSAVYAVNKSTKEVAWKYGVDAKINKQIAIDSGGNAYFSTQNGWVYSLSQTGGLNWKIDLSGTTSAYPVIGPGVLYITLDNARLVKIGE